MDYQFKAHIVIRGQLTCLTGLHIGGSEERYAIGGPDNPVIRDTASGLPFIPGSSLKGKMRSMLEWTLGKIEPDGSVHGSSCQDSACVICRLFGASTDRHRQEGQEIGPTRLLIRDAFLAEDTVNRFQDGGLFLTETKAENRLNRITAEAEPHYIERVPQGAQFDIEMIYGIYDLGDGGTGDVENLKQVYTAFELLEASVLGGGGSRGSGKVAIDNLQAIIKTGPDYQAHASGESVEWTTVTGRHAGDLIVAIREKLDMDKEQMS
jgi:CRISPR-associated protein Csm3